MIFEKKNLPDSLVKQLKNYVYDIINHLFTVYKKLPCGFPEYIYQEALGITLKENEVPYQKEFQYHPLFNGKPLDAYFKMDFIVERERRNIIIECKAIESIGDKERQQLFSYMIGTGFPVGILINFATYPKAQIEKYYYDKKDGSITPF